MAVIASNTIPRLRFLDSFQVKFSDQNKDYDVSKHGLKEGEMRCWHS